MRGLFAVFMIVDFSSTKISLKEINQQFLEMSTKIDLELNIEPYEAGIRRSVKKL